MGTPASPDFICFPNMKYICTSCTTLSCQDASVLPLTHSSKANHRWKPPKR